MVQKVLELPEMPWFYLKATWLVAGYLVGFGSENALFGIDVNQLYATKVSGNQRVNSIECTVHLSVQSSAKAVI